MSDDPVNPELLARQLRQRESELELLGCDLHDGLIQYVTAAGMMLSALRRRLEHQSEEVPEELLKAMEYLHEAAREGRQLIAGLQPNSDSGTRSADLLNGWIATRIADASIPVDVQIDLPGNLDGSLHRAIFRITQEALNNALRHSHATKVAVAIHASGDAVTITVSDDGSGFDPTQVDAGHFGLSSMRTRAETLNGTLSIRSAADRGTTVTATLPYTAG